MDTEANYVSKVKDYQDAFFSNNKLSLKRGEGKLYNLTKVMDRAWEEHIGGFARHIERMVYLRDSCTTEEFYQMYQDMVEVNGEEAVKDDPYTY